LTKKRLLHGRGPQSSRTEPEVFLPYSQLRTKPVKMSTQQMPNAVSMQYRIRCPEMTETANAMSPMTMSTPTPQMSAFLNPRPQTAAVIREGIRLTSVRDANDPKLSRAGTNRKPADAAR
jgi:hypothetical protein